MSNSNAPLECIFSPELFEFNDIVCMFSFRCNVLL